MLSHLNQATSGKKGSISLILILVFLVGLIYYSLRADKGNEKGIKSIEVATENAYLDNNVIALKIFLKIEDKEISLQENETLKFKINGYIASVIRGNDMPTENGVYRSFLVETFKEKSPDDVYQYLFAGIPVANIYNYHLIHRKSKTM